MRERGERTPLTHTHPTPHTPTLNTRIHLSASVLSDVLLLRLEHPPQSSRVPIPFTHTLHSSIHPSITLRQGGATGLSKGEQEKREDGRTTTTPFFPIAPPSDSPLDVYSPPQALQGGGREEHHHHRSSSSTPLSPCLAFFLVPSHRSKRFNSKQQDSAPLSFSFHASHTPSSPDTIGRPPSRGPFAVPL